jgi:hypothetical protein
LVRGVLAARWVSGVYLFRDERPRRRLLLGGALVLVLGAVLRSGAVAAPVGVAERTKGLIAEIEADPSVRELVGPALGHSRDALSRAAAETVPARATLTEETALEWAEVARDLVRASAAETASDRLEQEASATQTEIARSRAAVEGAMARVGQARHELERLEGTAPPRADVRAPASGAKPAAAPGSVPPKATAPGQASRGTGPSPEPEHP